MTRAELEDQIREVILSSVEADGLTAADIAPDTPLFGEGIGLTLSSLADFIAAGLEGTADEKGTA